MLRDIAEHRWKIEVLDNPDEMHARTDKRPIGLTVAPSVPKALAVPAIEKDYLIRLTQELARLAARLLKLRGDDAAELATLAAASRASTGLDLDALIDLPLPTVVLLLDEPGRVAAVAILGHEAERRGRAGEDASALLARASVIATDH
jgi:hypothetical protein